MPATPQIRLEFRAPRAWPWPCWTKAPPRRTALQISDQLAQLGANLGSGSRLDVSGVSLEALNEKLDPSLDIYSATSILHPSFPRADFERLKKQRLAQIQQEKADPVGLALRVFPGLLYGPGHAYANPWTGSGTEESTAEDHPRRSDAVSSRPGSSPTTPR